MRANFTIAMLFAFLVPGCAAAQALDLLDVYGLAESNDPGYLAERNRHEAILRSVPEAWGALKPRVTFAAEYTDTDQQINSSDNEVFGQGSSNYPTDVLSLSLTQPIFRWESIVKLRQAKSDVREAGVRLLQAEQDLFLRAARRYLELLAARDNLRFARAERQANQLQLEEVTRRKEVGYADITEVHESRARFEFSRSTVAEAESELEDAIAALREITGESIVDIKALSDAFELVPPDPADLEQWIARAMTGNLALEARNHAVESAELEVDRQRAQAFPRLDLLINGEQRNTEGSLFGGGSDVDTTEIMLRLEAPIYQGGQVSARKEAADYRFREAQNIAEKERRSVRRKTRAAYLGVVNGITRVEALEQSLKSQELTLESKQQGFQAGTNTNLEVLDAQRDLYLVRRDYAQARYDYLVSLLELKAQVGSLDLEDLEAVNRYLGGTS